MAATPRSQTEINHKEIIEEIMEELNATHGEQNELENVLKSAPKLR